MLLDAAGLEVVVQAGSGEELLSVLPGDEVPGVDAAIVDIRMPPTHRDEGIVTALELRRRHSGLGVLVLSAYTQTAYAAQLFAGGSKGLGYLLKDRVDDVASLRDALVRVVQGESVVDPQIVQRLLRLRERTEALQRLTPQERAVLTLMAEGRSNAGIAEELHVAPKTVESHASAIFGHLDLGKSKEDNRRVRAVLSWLRALDDA